MNIVMCDLQKQYQLHKDEINDEIQKVLNTGAYIGGHFVKAFEDKMKNYLGIKHAIANANGTDALYIAMKALNIQAGDEVITTPFTFVATTEMIVMAGAKPVYVDIEPETYNIDPKKILAKITSKTKGIIPVHIWGQAADMDAINAIAKAHNLWVIEDNAQGIGASYKGKKLGTLSDISTISFYPAKNLGAYGDGGMIVTNNDQLAEQIRMICNHGSKIRYYHESIGVNSRLDAIQAQVLSVKLNYLDHENECRREIAKKYNQKLNHPQITVPIYKDYGKANIHQYGILLEKRDALIDYLKSKNIPTAIHYPIPLHLQPAYQYEDQGNGSCPIAEKVASQVVNLPIHPYLTEQEIEKISQEILEFVNRG